MDFGFSEQQREVQTLARQILSREVSPEKLAVYDEYRVERFDAELWGKLAEAGLLGVAVEEAYGGMGFGFTELALLVEELGRSIAPLPLLPHAVSAALPVQKFGSAALKERLLPGVVRGATLLTAGLLEPVVEDPSCPASVTASVDGDGYRVSGVKSCVPFAGSASRIMISARTDTGIVVLLLDPTAPGVSLTPLQYTTYEPQCELSMNEARVAAEDLLAGPENGAEVMRYASLQTKAALCAHQLGVTDQALRMTASYTSQREQFGVPIASFQAVGHRAANCFIDVECLRLTTYQAASMLDSEAQADADIATAVQVAKFWAGEVGHRVSYAAQHLHGGTGVDRDYPLWRFCLWARHNEAMLGGSARQLALLGESLARGEAYCT